MQIENTMGDRAVIVQMRPMTFRQINRMRSKHIQPKVKISGKKLEMDDVSIDAFGLGLDAMTTVVDSVSINGIETAIGKEEDWDNIDPEICDWIYTVVMEKFFHA